MRFYLKRYIERYFVRAIVLFLATVTNKAVSFFPHKTQFGASDVSTKVELYDFFLSKTIIRKFLNTYSS